MCICICFYRGFLAYKLALYRRYAPLNSFAYYITDMPSDRNDSNATTETGKMCNNRNSGDTNSIDNKSNEPLYQAHVHEDIQPSHKGYEQQLRVASLPLATLQWYRAMALLEYIKGRHVEDVDELAAVATNTESSPYEYPYHYYHHSSQMADTLWHSLYHPRCAPMQPLPSYIPSSLESSTTLPVMRSDDFHYDDSLPFGIVANLEDAILLRRYDQDHGLYDRIPSLHPPDQSNEICSQWYHYSDDDCKEEDGNPYDHATYEQW
jgi:hypothetical protein